MSAPPPRRLQVLLKTDPSAASVAGLPCAVRSAFRAGTELSPERIVVSGADDSFLRRWSFQFRSAGAPVSSDRAGAPSLDASLPLLALAPDAFPDENGLRGFLDTATRTSGGARRLLNGRPVAVYLPDPSVCKTGQIPPADVHASALHQPARELPAGGFFDARTPESAASAARSLYARLGKDNDGYLARFDRRLSLAITRLLLPFPISPNMVTAASLLIGLYGAWLLAAPSAAAQFGGALTLWFCCLLDGCDGEIARLKHHVTPHGGKFDLLADHVAHLATFVAIPVGVARLHPGADWRLPGALLVGGFLACGFAVWKLVLRVPEERRGPSSLVVERIASRDYVYLLVALTAVSRLDWFVWAAAIGSHAFWLWLLWTNRRPSLPERLPIN